MITALVFPPTCDPTAPYISVPLLSAFLRHQGMEVRPLDANVEGWDVLLSPQFLKRCQSLWRNRAETLVGRKSLSHAEQRDLVQVWRAQADASVVPSTIDDAKTLLRGGKGDDFFRDECYRGAVERVESAQRLISAAFAPLSLSFVEYRTPFGMQSLQEVAYDAAAERDPFRSYYESQLLPRLADASLVGLSVVFPGQLQPAYAIASLLRQRYPSVQVTVGGPAFTQLLLRLPAKDREAALGPFHSAVLYEGEEALTDLARRVERGEKPSGLLEGTRNRPLVHTPPPDFSGLPLDKYLSPQLVLPYDPTRGCYWGKCAFCHYGLCDRGTARYRERPVTQVADDLAALSRQHGTQLFHLSQDAFAPQAALRLARRLGEIGEKVYWSSDIRAEKSLNQCVCEELAAGGALSLSFGVESGSDRVLALMDKGVDVATMEQAMAHAAGAGIAVEAMCFTDFPTESFLEAKETLDFIARNRRNISLFICGEFHLVSGSRVALEPEAFGLGRTWNASGDTFRSILFYEEKRESKSEREHERLAEELEKVGRPWRLSHYPWAGALSTAHTLLWYRKKGRDAFHGRWKSSVQSTFRDGGREKRNWGFDMERLAAVVENNEAALWSQLIWEEKRVSRVDYEALAKEVPVASPRKFTSR